MAKNYDFDSIIEKCSSGSDLDKNLDELQTHLKNLRLLINDAELLYHGVGLNSKIYRMYEDIYSVIGSTNSYNVWANFGMWNAILKVQSTAAQLKKNAEDDKEEYEEEQREAEENNTDDDFPMTWRYF